MPLKKEITIVCDQRERSSSVISELTSFNSNDISINIKLEKLSIGDYQITDEIIIERKTISDLESSIIDGRIFSQLQELLKFSKPCLIIEGNMNLVYNNNTRLNKKAIIGLLTSIGINYKVPIFFTKNQKETSEFLYVIAKREQLGNGYIPKLRYTKNKLSFSQRQIFIMESFPDIGPSLARTILKEFKTLKNIVNSDISDLKKVSKLGSKKADKLKYLFERKFD
jgi:Fanconi anemia group M protein